MAGARRPAHPVLAARAARGPGRRVPGPRAPGHRAARYQAACRRAAGRPPTQTVLLPRLRVLDQMIDCSRVCARAGRVVWTRDVTGPQCVVDSLFLSLRLFVTLSVFVSFIYPIYI